MLVHYLNCPHNKVKYCFKPKIQIQNEFSVIETKKQSTILDVSQHRIDQYFLNPNRERKTEGAILPNSVTSTQMVGTGTSHPRV